MATGARTRRVLLGAALALATAACGGGGGGGGSPIAPGALVPDFALPDVNDASPSFGTGVSPRDRLGAVSAWYFGHAT